MTLPPHTSPLAGLLLSACVLPSMVMPAPVTSAPKRPESVWRELGPTRGESSRVCGVAGFVDEHPDEVLWREAFREAVDAVPDASALINVITASHVHDYGLFALCRVEITGTAVRPVPGSGSAVAGDCGVGL